MAKYHVETDGGTFEVETEDTPAESTLNLTKKLLPVPTDMPSNIIDVAKRSVPFSSIIQNAPEIGSAAVAADRRVPAQNILPIIGGAAGGLAGGAATLPSGAGVPFGATVGSGIGAGAMQPVADAISALRGQYDNVPKDIPSSLKKSAITGTEMSLSELAGAGLLKAVEMIGVGRLATKGFQTFKNKLLDVLTPVKGARDAAMDQLSSVPIKDVSSTEKVIGDIFDKHGVEVPEVQNAQYEQKFQDLVGRGMKSADAQMLLKNDPSLQNSVSRIAQGKIGNLTSKYETTKLGDFQAMGDTLSDLRNPDNTYYDVYRIQNNIARKAGFEKPAIERTPIEKDYGRIYNSLDDVMKNNADKADLGDIHDMRTTEGSKYFQNRNLQDIINNSTTRIKGNEGVNWGKLAGNLKSYDDSQLAKEFGTSNVWLVKSLRDMAETNAKTFSQEITPHAVMNETGAPSIYTRLNPVRLIERARTPAYAQKIVSNYAPNPADVIPTAEKLYPTFPKTRRIAGVASQLPFPVVQNQQ